MKKADLSYSYPEELVATEPVRPSRVLWVPPGGARPEELSPKQTLDRIPPGDIFVINNTQVLKRRVFAGELEILFLNPVEKSQNGSQDPADGRDWWVLFPSRKYSVGEEIELPLGVKAVLQQKGRPQRLQTSEALTEDYFEKVGELPLPPYIQKARGERHNQEQDSSWYQTAWAQRPGSYAAPTASLHFSVADIEELRQRGVKVLEITLHVGLGTFLPVTAEDLDEHQMHSESIEISHSVVRDLRKAQLEGRKVWALGTTVTRALEAWAQGHLTEGEMGAFGETNLLIQPGYQFRVIDRLLTNFHQPESTLLALVSGFAGLERVKEVYQLAIEKRFRLFSYGDLSVWLRD